jgi:hypothetical protein
VGDVLGWQEEGKMKLVVRFIAAGLEQSGR